MVRHSIRAQIYRDIDEAAEREHVRQEFAPTDSISERVSQIRLTLSRIAGPNSYGMRRQTIMEVVAALVVMVERDDMIELEYRHAMREAQTHKRGQTMKDHLDKLAELIAGTVDTMQSEKPVKLWTLPGCVLLGVIPPYWIGIPVAVVLAVLLHQIFGDT